MVVYIKCKVKLAQLFIIFEHCQQNLILPTKIVSRCYSSSTDRCNSLLQTLALLVSRNFPLSSVLSTCNGLVCLWLHKMRIQWTSSMAHIPRGLTDSLTALFGLTNCSIQFLVAGNVRQEPLPYNAHKF